MTIQFALFASATFISAPVTEAPDIERLHPPEYLGQRCHAGEETLFAGDVQDDFGLGIAVCVADETVTIRYSGEGDPQAVSCRIPQCKGVIEFNHYVRYRFTEITLTWRDANGEQRLTESFDAQNLDERPVKSVSHTWRPARQDADHVEVPVYPVLAYTDPLSLVALSRWDWP